MRLAANSGTNRNRISIVTQFICLWDHKQSILIKVVPPLTLPGWPHIISARWQFQAPIVFTTARVAKPAAGEQANLFIATTTATNLLYVQTRPRIVSPA